VDALGVGTLDGFGGGAGWKDGVEVRRDENAGGRGGRFRSQLCEGVAFVVEVNVGEAEGTETIEEEFGALLFVKGGRGYADDVEQPVTDLRLVEMQPVKGAMHRCESCQLRNPLMGGGRHLV